MALSNLFGWNKNEDTPSTACGAGDKLEEKPAACGAGDKLETFGSACGAGDK